MERRRKQFLQTAPGLILFFFGGIYMLVSLLWLTRPDLMGAAFHTLRMAESLGTWPLWSGGWDRVFADAGLYRPGMSAMASASMPFGLIAVVVMTAIGAVAMVRVKMDHLDGFASTRKPRAWRAVMEAQSHRHPANRFFLDYDLSAMPLDEGPARMPERALELLVRADAIVEVLDPPLGEVPAGTHAGPALVIRDDRLAEALMPALGPANPFLTAPDAEAAVEALSWPAAILLRASLERIAARDRDGSAEAFAATVAAVSARMDDVWRHLNALKARHGAKLVLGTKDASAGGITLAEALHDDNPAAADRRWLVEALSRDHPELLGLVKRNHYLSGCLATMLVETRTAGIFPPESFRWLRFVDYPLWCFLRTVGAPACAPVAAGAQAHWLAERQTSTPIEAPRFAEACRALRVEARKYLTDETVRRLRETASRQAAAAGETV